MADYKRVGNYEIQGRIGRGGMGAVFRARQVNMDRVVALKVLPPSLAKQPTFIERFMREARASAKLNHPNIVNGIDVGHQGGLYYFAMEYIEGGSLKSLIDKEQRLAEDRAVEIARDIALALDHAHTHGILHRDIKPDNILIDKAGNAKLCDLGLAHLATESDEEKSLTQDGRAVGTPHYISPEQARGADLDATTDLYSLGATLYHMVTGVTLFQGATSVVVMTKHLAEKPVEPAAYGAELSEGLLKILAKLVQKNRADRYSSAKKLADDLDRVLRNREPKFADLPENKWPFKEQSGANHPAATKGPLSVVSASAPGRKAIISSSQLERSSHNLRLARRNLRSSSESGVPIAAFVGVGVLLAGVLVFLLSASDGEPKNTKPVTTVINTRPVAMAERHEAPAPATYTPAVPKTTEIKHDAPKEEPKAHGPEDVVGVAHDSGDVEALASMPKSRVNGDALVDPPPGIDTAALLHPPIQKVLSEARVALHASNFKGALAKVEQIRKDYAGTPELNEQATELARIEKLANSNDPGVDVSKYSSAKVAEAKAPAADPDARTPLLADRPEPKVEKNEPKPEKVEPKIEVKELPKKETKPEPAKVAEAKQPKPEPKTFNLMDKATRNESESSSSSGANAGTFTLTKSDIYYSGYKSGSVDFAYQPPEEYDYKLVFRIESTTPSGTSAKLAPYGYVLQYVPIGSKSLVWYLPYGSNGYYAFDNINKTRYSEGSNPTRHEYTRLKPGQDYTAVIKVRRDRIIATLDDVAIMAWPRDGINPTTDADVRLGDSRNLGVGAMNRINLHILDASITEFPTEVANKR